MKKLMVSGALALALSTSALVAEESGGFVGVDLGLASLTKMTMIPVGQDVGLSINSLGNLRYGLVGGYKWFFTQNVGLRAYVAVNNGASYGGAGQFNSLFVNANVDFLNTFYNSEQVFSNLSNISGFDLGINLGLRTLFGKHHGVEFFTRFGALGASATGENGGVAIADLNTNQIYNAGIRYTYNF